MRMMLASPGNGARITLAPPVEQCPFFPRIVMPVVLPGHLSSPPESGVAEALLRGQPTGSAQIQAQLRVSFANSRQKRGPPSLFLWL